MQISFFVEFPKTDLDGLKYLSWPTKLYATARDLEEFNSLKKKLKNRHVKEFIYWPALSKKEGYWISPFSNRNGLIRIFEELKNSKIPVMIDAELPTTQNLSLYITQAFNFFRNRKLIRKFIKDYKKVYVAEYYPQRKFMTSVLRYFGLHFDPRIYDCKSIRMVYHSMHRFNKEFIVNELKNGKKEFGNDFLVAYGTIAPGISGCEPKLSLSQLKEDLEIAEHVGIKEVIIFRLGGLDRKYLKVLNKFIS